MKIDIFSQTQPLTSNKRCKEKLSLSLSLSPAAKQQQLQQKSVEEFTQTKTSVIK